jgi:DNA-binding response OmpR family regulator
MFRNSHRALTRGYLIDAVWGPTMDPGSRALDTHMSRLKSKLGPTAGRRFEFEPIYGYGYRLKPAGRAPVAARQA